MYAYPNPFNSTTTIKYKLPYPGHVSLQIYNPVGQRVLTLFEGYRQGGVYSIDWRAEDFSSSVYLLRLKLDKLTKTSKVLLVR